MARNRKALGCLNANWTVTTSEDRPVFLIGNTRELGEWNPDEALPLSAQHVGRHLHDWNVDLVLPRGQTIEFKFIQKTERGDVLWEEGENRSFTAKGPHTTTHWGPFR